MPGKSGSSRGMKLLERWIPFVVALFYTTGSTLSLLRGNTSTPEWFWFLGGVTFSSFSLFRAVKHTLDERKQARKRGGKRSGPGGSRDHAA